jgi:hypothetical protein
LNLFDPLDHTTGRFADEPAVPPQVAHEVPGDVPELGGKILVDEQDAHGVVVVRGWLLVVNSPILTRFSRSAGN